MPEYCLHSRVLLTFICVTAISESYPGQSGECSKWSFATLGDDHVVLSFMRRHYRHVTFPNRRRGVLATCVPNFSVVVSRNQDDLGRKMACCHRQKYQALGSGVRRTRASHPGSLRTPDSMPILSADSFCLQVIACSATAAGGPAAKAVGGRGPTRTGFWPRARPSMNP